MSRTWQWAIAGALLAAGCESAGNGAADAADGSASDSTGAEFAWKTGQTDHAPGAFLSVWADGADNVWLAGGESGHAELQHFDGAQWNSVDTGLQQPLWWVQGFGNGSLAVVGDRGSLATFDGSSWSTIDTGVPDSTLFGVWGTSIDDLWVVGGPSFFAQQEGAQASGPVLQHWNGTAWEPADLAAILGSEVIQDNQSRALYKVWGIGDHLFVVGDKGWALHRVNGVWTVQETGLDGTLFTVVGRASDDVFAIGGVGVPTLLHWDGAEWSSVGLPPDAPSVVQGVWTEPGAHVYVSGWSGFAAQWDGMHWEIADAPSTAAYHAIAGAGAQRWMVGGDIQAAKTDYTGAWASTDDRAPTLTGSR